MLFTREKLMQRERATLAPYATFSDESRGRQHPERDSTHRTPYQKDRDRVLHTTAFRRLQYKTQVFVNDEGDHYRTRLTHTLEVTQVARSLALALGVNETLAETIALAHDLGHPPFGHAGERLLNRLMQGHGGYEHNRQTLRIVTQLERRHEHPPGLNLTWETLEGIAKHESLTRTLQSDDTPGYEPTWRPSLEAQIANVADETAYNAHDLEDGLRSGLITPRDLRGLRLWDRLTRELNLDPTYLHDTERRALIRELQGWMIHDLIAESHRRIETSGVRTLADVRRHTTPLVCHTEDARAQLQELKSFLFTRLYNHHRVVKQVHKAEHFLTTLFHAYLNRPGMLPPSVREREAHDGLHRAICDYLAGMTDRYAMDEYRRLYDPYVHT